MPNEGGTVGPVQLERPETNAQGSIIIIPKYRADDPHAAISTDPKGAKGTYRVTFVLATGSGTYRGDLDLQNFTQSGESLLLVSKDVARLDIKIFNKTEAVEVRVATKSIDGAAVLATAQLRVSADSFEAAERYAFDIVMPLLSWWSFRYDVAIDISGYEVVFEDTEAKKWTMGLLGKAKSFSESGSLSKLHYRMVLASYREGVNSASPFYQFLCFFRVIEAVKKLRDQRRTMLLEQGKILRLPSERIPSRIDNIEGVKDAGVLENFRPYLGKKFAFVQDQFRGLLRNAVAHLDPTATEDLSADRFDDHLRFAKALPVVKYMSRVMLMNELKADPDVASHLG